MILFLSDINECSISNGGCSHSCHNSAGSFTCSCPSGLELDPEKRSCRGEVKANRHQVVGVLSDLAFSNSFAGLSEQTSTYVVTNTEKKKKFLTIRRSGLRSDSSLFSFLLHFTLLLHDSSMALSVV